MIRLPVAHTSCLTLLALSALVGCAADPGKKTDAAATTTVSVATATSENARAARISFYFSDYFSLTSPNPASACAGDARTYYDPIAWDPGSTSATGIVGYAVTGLTGTSGAPGPLSYPKDVYDADQTIRPSFIKNISVDLTDTGANVASNAAYSCSMGNAPGVPPVAQCASFDYGALGGIPTTLGGSMLIVGGLQGYNFSGYTPSTLPTYYAFQGATVGCGPANLVYSSLLGSNYCRKDMVALGIDSLPASVYYSDRSLIPGFVGAKPPTTAISNWSTLSASASYTGPSGATASSLTYDPATRKVLLFGGASPISATDPTGAGQATYDTWIYNLKTQKWDISAGTPLVATSLTTQPDYQLPIAGNNGIAAAQTTSSAIQISRPVSGRILAGYTAVPGMSLQHDYWNTAGVVDPFADRDRADRILIAGGTDDGISTNGGMHRFNPTFGPDMVFANDLIGGPNPPWINPGGSAPALPAVYPVQWLESYHTQLMSNSLGSLFDTTQAYGAANHSRYTDYSSLLTADVDPPGYTGGPTNEVGGSTLINNSVAPWVDNDTKIGGLFSMGGTRTTATRATSNAGTSLCVGAPLLSCNGNPLILTRFRFNTGANVFPPAAPYAPKDTTASTFLAVPNYRSGQNLAPSQWMHLDEPVAATAATVNATPYVVGSTLLPGFDLTTNEMVYFGGLDCVDYLTGACVSAYQNPGKYWRFGENPGTVNQLPTVASISFNGGASVPMLAGMAAARGTDANANVLIVAWGGQPMIGSPAGGDLYYLWNSAGTPTWVKLALSGTIPLGLVNAQMVFSHVTKKFYVYGGVDTVTGITRAETWELAVSGLPGAYTFTWKQLTPTAYPSVGPGVRRSHRMTEANYNNVDPSSNPTCSTAAPCSFGIFMEGGTNDGSHLLSDRWMFDPTANGGTGHWQKMGDLPPRVLGMATSTDYYIPTKAKTVHRALLFGGETGMQAPEVAALESGTTRYFVPPTLGDTWMFDYDTNTWNRVELLGKGYASATASLATLSETEQRQAYNAQGAGGVGTRYPLAYLTPPPLSGGILLTRTFARDAAGVVTPLKIPEAFLFGGRKQDGRFHTLDNVYKFCAGTTGERYSYDLFPGGTSPGATDFTCDAYDASTNTASASPTDAYVGRWLKKSPVFASAPGVYLGAGAYDSTRDRILIFGGINGVAANSVTETAALAGNSVYEYAPPQFGSGVPATDLNGAWTTVVPCTGYTAPTARYGHSMAYDPLTQSLLITGGMGATHSPLLQTVSFSDGRSYAMPDTWSGRYTTDAAHPTGCLAWVQKTTFGNSFDSATTAPPSSGLAFAATTFIPSQGYNSGFYSLFDNACAGQGPIGTPDPNINKLLAGGVYIDIDREKMGPNENLILNLTYLPLSPANLRPDRQPYTQDESALFKVHLVRTGQSNNSLAAMIQPRHLSYSAVDVYPQIAQSISVLPRTYGQMAQEQIFIPLSADPAIDRIRIERYAGSGLLLDASVYRLGGGK